jgi:hypothetical protein
MQAAEVGGWRSKRSKRSMAPAWPASIFCSRAFRAFVLSELNTLPASRSGFTEALSRFGPRVSGALDRLIQLASITRKAAAGTTLDSRQSAVASRQSTVVNRPSSVRRSPHRTDEGDWPLATTVAVACPFPCAGPLRPLTEGRASRPFTAILDARFDRIDAQLKEACPPAPGEACASLAVVSLWWQIQMRPESRLLDDRFNELAAAAIAASGSWTKREPGRAEAWFYLAGSYAPLVQWRVLRGERIAARAAQIRTRSSAGLRSIPHCRTPISASACITTMRTSRRRR